MTDVVYAPRREDPNSDAEPIISSGYVQVRLSRAAVVNGQWVQPVWSEPIEMTGAAIPLKLDAVADPPYELWHHDIDDGDGDTFDIHEFRIVTSSGSALNWESLTQVGGPGAPVVVDSSLAARVAALEAQIGSVSGGASTVGAITDMSAPARTFNQQTSYANMRSTLGTAATSHTHVATTDLTATGTKTSATFLRGDNTWAIPPGSAAGLDDYTDISGLPGYPSTFPPALPIAQSGVTGLATSLSALSTSIAGKADASGGTLLNPNVGTQVATNSSNLAASTAFVQGLTAWAYGIQPRIVWTGIAWPSRAASIPPGYTGPVEYWSPYDSSAPSPSDALIKDLWTRKRVA